MTQKFHSQIEAVKSFLLELQDSLCDDISKIDGQPFEEESWHHEAGSGGGRTRVLENSKVIEKGGVNFSHVRGEKLPPAATLKRPELAGKAFQAMGVSLVLHPQNPFAPTSHMNVRFFVAGEETDEPIWWFGGGFDLTPYYGFEEDVVHWHSTAKAACDPYGIDAYKKYKDWCDQYFCLSHRGEQRGVGGLFFDDLNEQGFSDSFGFMKSVGKSFSQAYLPILIKRKDMEYSEENKQWQLIRRGRYVEFNLVHDRGTLFGLQSSGRTESILMSMPPMVSWQYRHEPKQNSEESKLLDYFLVPRDWLA